MRIPPEKLEEISSASDIVEVISHYIPVKKRGKSFLAVCPFHPDKNPSLHISQEKQVYHCFSCKASGNVFSFVQNYEKIGFIDAAQKLADWAGITLMVSGKGFDTSNEVSILYEINRAAADYFRKMLSKVRGNEREFVHTYLRKRNIDEKVAEEFGIGYSLNKWDSLLNHFLEEGNFKPEELEKAGLLIKRENEKEGYYDRFRGRLMFPIFNESGKVVGFGGRKLLEDDPGGKYINSPETRLYNKSRILYGLNFAKDHIRYADSAILVEGYMDLISMHRHGIKNVVASSGTALTEEQVKLLSRYTKKIYVLFDADTAGVSAAKRGTEMILQGGLDLDVVTLPEGEDPDSFLGSKGKEEFEKQIKSGKSVIEFISELHAKEGKLNSVAGKTEFIREIISYISGIPDKIKRALYLKDLAIKYSLYESDLLDELNKALKRNNTPSFPASSLVIPEREYERKSTKKNDAVTVSERELLKAFIRGDVDAIGFIENNLETSLINNPKVLRVVEHFLDDCVNHEKLDVNRVIHALEEEECISLIMDAIADKHEPSFFEDSTFDSLLEKEVAPVFDLEHAKAVINSLKIDHYKRQIEELRRDPDNLKEVHEIQKQIAQLKKYEKWQERL
jgi:DNA primase